MLPPPRPSVVRAYGECQRRWDQMRTYARTHPVHFQRLGQASCSFRTDFIVIEMECCEGLPRRIERLKSDGSICMNAPDWLRAHEPYMSHLHHRYCCFVDQVWWESTENTRDDEIRWMQVPDLTRLIFRASATHVAPPPLILLYWRWSVVRVYGQYQRRCDQMGASTSTHLVDLQRITHISHSFIIDAVVLEIKCGEGLWKIPEMMYLDGSICMNSLGWFSALQPHISILPRRFYFLLDEV